MLFFFHGWSVKLNSSQNALIRAGSILFFVPPNFYKFQSRKMGSGFSTDIMLRKKCSEKAGFPFLKMSDYGREQLL